MMESEKKRIESNKNNNKKKAQKDFKLKLKYFSQYI